MTARDFEFVRVFQRYMTERKVENSKTDQAVLIDHAVIKSKPPGHSLVAAEEEECRKETSNSASTSRYFETPSGPLRSSTDICRHHSFSLISCATGTLHRGRCRGRLPEFVWRAASSFRCLAVDGFELNVTGQCLSIDSKFYLPETGNLQNQSSVRRDETWLMTPGLREALKCLPDPQ